MESDRRYPPSDRKILRLPFGVAPPYREGRGRDPSSVDARRMKFEASRVPAGRGSEGQSVTERARRRLNAAPADGKTRKLAGGRKVSGWSPTASSGLDLPGELSHCHDTQPLVPS